MPADHLATLALMAGVGGRLLPPLPGLAGDLRALIEAHAGLKLDCAGAARVDVPTMLGALLPVLASQEDRRVEERCLVPSNGAEPDREDLRPSSSAVGGWRRAWADVLGVSDACPGRYLSVLYMLVGADPRTHAAYYDAAFAPTAFDLANFVHGILINHAEQPPYDAGGCCDACCSARLLAGNPRFGCVARHHPLNRDGVVARVLASDVRHGCVHMFPAAASWTSSMQAGDDRPQPRLPPLDLAHLAAAEERVRGTAVRA
jgi:hypothetical protein